MGNGRVTLGIENDGADGPRPGEQRDPQRDDGNRVALHGVLHLLLRVLGLAGLGVEHGDRDQHDQDTAANPERSHGDAEEREDGLPERQRDQQHKRRGDGAAPAGSMPFDKALAIGEFDEYWNRPDRVNNGDQGGQKFKVFGRGTGFHEQRTGFCAKLSFDSQQGLSSR